MGPNTRHVDLGFCSEHFPSGTHICLIYRDEGERRRIVAKYLESGLEGGEEVRYFADLVSPEEVVAWLRDEGLAGATAGGGGQFEARDARSVYCPDGSFVPERTWQTLRDTYDESEALGYTACRVCGEMSWALRGLPGSDRLIEYEAGVNRVLKTHPVTAMCQYDANSFDGTTIFQALQVHPYLVMNNRVVHNPYYEYPR